MESLPEAYITLKEIAKALRVNPSELYADDNIAPSLSTEEVNGWSIVKAMNLSSLSVLIIPLSNIILPIIIFRKNRTNRIVHDCGPKILSVQLLWIVFSLLIMVIISVVIALFYPEFRSAGIPIFVPVYFVTVFINVLLILRMAVMFNREDASKIKLPNLL